MVRKLHWLALGGLAALVLVFSDGVRAEVNQLTKEEQSQGWELLFDGRSTSGWRGMKGTPFPSQSWTIEDGTLRTQEDGSGGDVISEKEYSSFELSVEWKISPGGNSGIKYLVQEEWLSPHFQPDLPERQKRNQWLSAVGPEYQIYDDDRMRRRPGWEKSSTGALYLLYPPENKQVNPPGEWNHSRIVVRGDHVEHWLNGRKLLEYEMNSPELLDLVQNTKFHKVPGFGIRGPGNIVLQHHGTPAWFRNIKIRERTP